jgi:hypothetical protein
MAALRDTIKGLLAGTVVSRNRDDLRPGLQMATSGRHCVFFEADAYGIVYEIEGPIKTPSGKTVRFCSIWQIDGGTDVPRFITMYPR